MWMAVFAPSRTPKNVVTRLNAEIGKTLTMPDVRERFAALGVESVGSTPEQLGMLLNSEIDKYARITRAIGLSVD